MLRYLHHFAWLASLICALFCCTSCAWRGFPHCLQSDDCQPQEICFGGSCHPGADRDCDGVLDPIPLAGPVSRACYSGERGCTKEGAGFRCQGGCQAGQQVCASAAWGACKGEQLPQAEVCNGKDDDCNGEIDEADPALGKPCQDKSRQGPCRDGVWRCQGGALVCYASHQARVETCDGIDDDCDGKTDEGCCVLPFVKRRVFPHNKFHLGVVSTIRYSPDGKWIATGGNKGVIKLWDARTRAFVRSLRGHNYGIQSLAFHPIQPTLVSVSEDARVVFWEVPSGKRLHVHREHPGPVFAVAIHPKGTMFATGAKDTRVRLWRWDPKMQEHTLLRTMEGHDQRISDVRFHPDGERLFSSGVDGTIRSWRIADGVALHKWSARSQSGASISISKMSIHPDGARLAAGLGDHSVRIWSLKEPTQAPMILKGHPAAVHSVAWVPGTSLLVSVGDANSSKPQKTSHWVWDGDTGVLQKTLPDSLSFRNMDLAFSPVQGETTLVIASVDKSVQWWDSSSWTLLGRQRLPYDGAHSGRVKSMALRLGKTPTLFTASEDRFIRAWREGDGSGIGSKMSGHGGWLFRIAVNPAQTILASVSADHTLRLWDAQTHQIKRVIQVASASARLRPTLAFSRDGALVMTATEDKFIQIWDVATGQRTKLFQLPESSAVWARFQANDKQIMSVSGNGSVAVFDIASGAALAAPTLFSKGQSFSSVTAVDRSADGSLLAVGTAQGRLLLFSLATNQVVHTLFDPESSVINRLTFHPSGEYIIASFLSGSFGVWETQSGKLVQHEFAHSEGTWDLVFAPDGRRFFATGGDAQITEWSCER